MRAASRIPRPEAPRPSLGLRVMQGETGPEGNSGPMGPAGPQGLTGPQGPSGSIGTIDSVVSSRALNTTFQPSTTKSVRVGYTIRTQVTNPLLAGASRGEVKLLCDANNPPATERGRCAAESSVALTVSIAITTANECVVDYTVPPGHYVRLASSGSGTFTNSIVAQVEQYLG